MAKTKRVFNRRLAPAFAGVGGIAQYFNIIKKRGRPSKKCNQENSEIEDNASDIEDNASNIAPLASQDGDEGKTESQSKEEEAPQKKKRRNWGVGDDRLLMDKAVNDWFEKGELKYDDNGEEITDYRIYARRECIPVNTFYKYICTNNRRKIGDGRRGKRRILEDEDIKFVGNVCARADRANDGLSRKEATDVIQQLKPNINRFAAARQLSRVVIPKNAAAGLIKCKTQKVQGTTSDRTNINTAQQYRWHKNVDMLYDELQEKNTGLCQSSGKRFCWVMEHFIIGLDEMCLMSDQHGGLQVIGASDKKKHEKLLQDSRVSITIVRTGTVGGTTGPTIFLIKGDKVRKHYSDEFLVRNGCAPGSTVIATENAYMTDQAWEKTTVAIVKGYRHLPYVKENPQWWVAELLDGFKSHENVLAAHQLRAENKISSLKEESNTSHANQGYDQLVAKNDKKVAAETLYVQRSLSKFRTGKTNIDQYDLILTGISLVGSTTSDMVSQSGLYVCLFFLYETHTHHILMFS